jgi:hypothetical protein
MPGTDDDARLIANMPPGTRVRHTIRLDLGPGTISPLQPQHDQILVLFDSGLDCYCYPVNLEIIPETP